ncbi:MAG TPA: hypothetical protein V6D23_24065 [Candidatus Obscuribacterales bacterium]
MEKATILYADGSANSYLLTPKPEPQIEYSPVKPEFSSTGTYDGGEPVTRKISREQHQRILEAVRAALENKAVHIKDRIKMSGLVRVKTDEGEVTVILTPGCAEQKALEQALKQSLQP